MLVYKKEKHRCKLHFFYRKKAKYSLFWFLGIQIYFLKFYLSLVPLSFTFHSELLQSFRMTSESVATLPPFSPIERQKWFDQISSQWESQKNRFALIYFGKIQFLTPCIWNLPFMSTASVHSRFYFLYWFSATSLAIFREHCPVKILNIKRIFIQGGKLF